MKKRKKEKLESEKLEKLQSYADKVFGVSRESSKTSKRRSRKVRKRTTKQPSAVTHGPPPAIDEEHEGDMDEQDEGDIYEEDEGDIDEEDEGDDPLESETLMETEEPPGSASGSASMGGATDKDEEDDPLESEMLIETEEPHGSASGSAPMGGAADNGKQPRDASEQPKNASVQHWESLPRYVRQKADTLFIHKVSIRDAKFYFVVLCAPYENICVTLGVNPANAQCSNAAGLAKVLADLGGDEFRRLCKQAVDTYGPLTKERAYELHLSRDLNMKLLLRFCVCVAAPDLRSKAVREQLDEDDRYEWLHNNYENVFKSAKSLRVHSVSTVPLGIGIFRNSVKQSVHAAVDAFKQFAQDMASEIDGEFFFYFISNDKNTAQQMAMLSEEKFEKSVFFKDTVETRHASQSPDDEWVSSICFDPDRDLPPNDGNDTEASSEGPEAGEGAGSLRVGGSAMLSFLGRGDGPVGERAQGKLKADEPNAQETEPERWAMLKRVRTQSSEGRAKGHPKPRSGMSPSQKSPADGPDGAENSSLWPDSEIHGGQSLELSALVLHEPNPDAQPLKSSLKEASKAPASFPQTLFLPPMQRDEEYDEEHEEGGMPASTDGQ